MAAPADCPDEGCDGEHVLAVHELLRVGKVGGRAEGVVEEPGVLDLAPVETARLVELVDPGFEPLGHTGRDREVAVTADHDRRGVLGGRPRRDVGECCHSDGGRDDPDRERSQASFESAQLNPPQVEPLGAVPLGLTQESPPWGFLTVHLSRRLTAVAADNTIIAVALQPRRTRLLRFYYNHCRRASCSSCPACLTGSFPHASVLGDQHARPGGVIGWISTCSISICSNAASRTRCSRGCGATIPSRGTTIRTGAAFGAWCDMATS